MPCTVTFTNADGGVSDVNVAESAEEVITVLNSAFVGNRPWVSLTRADGDKGIGLMVSRVQEVAEQ